MRRSDNQGVMSNINITPYIDILLVMLIVFMVTAPLKQYEHQIRVPQPAVSAPPQDVRQDTIIVDMALDRTIRLNQKIVTLQELENTLTEVFERRALRQLFIRGDFAIPYGDVFIVMDIAKRSGATDIALLARRADAADIALLQ